MTDRIPRVPSILCLVLAVAACAAQVGDLPAGDPMPDTPKRPVTDTYHGVAVVDDYRWLEDGADPEVRAWSDAQNARTRAVLDHLPGVEAIRERLTALLKTESVSYRSVHAAGATLFAIKDQRPKQQPFLVAMDASTCDPATEHVVLDPNALDAKGTTAIDWYVPSHDGKLVAVSLSQRGTESGTVHVYDAATGVVVGESIPRVNGGTAGGSLAWNADGSGFWYTRYPRGSERPPQDMDFFQQVFFHKLGTPTEADTYEVGREFPRIAEVHLDSGDDGKLVLASVSNGDGGEYSHWLRAPDGRWTQVTRFEDGVVRAELTPVGSLCLLSRNKAPRGKLLEISDWSQPSLDRATELLAQGQKTITRFVVTRAGTYVVMQTGGAEDVAELEWGSWSRNSRPYGEAPPSWRARPLQVGDVSSIGEIAPIGDGVIVRHQGYTRPPRWDAFATEPAESPTPPVILPGIAALSDAVDTDFSDIETVQEWATSKDGTKVPFMIVRRKGTPLDGNNPTLLNGYGGYGISMAPRYRKQLRVWFDHGGVFAVASTRGGGEFGKEWHLAGNLTKKQNVFDDFAACAERLIELKITRPARMAFQGGSNGGLLMGAMIVQRPDLCRAVVASVGIFDMLRVETTPNGAFNVTEFGTVKDPDHFRALHAYSPFHNVVDGTRYPAVLFLTGANDPRVEPYNSRKMTARLHAANASVPGAHPVLLRTSASSGHGMGSSLDERIEQDVDVYAFLLHELGVEIEAR